MRASKLRPDTRVDQSMISRMSPHFGTGWRRVFRYLEINDDDIDVAKQEGGQLQETCFSLLLRWTQQSETPSVQALVHALVRGGDQTAVIRALLQC